MSTAKDQSRYTQELLTINRRHLHYLNKQIAQYGGEMGAPTAKLYQRDETAAEIKRLEAELRQLAPAPEENPRAAARKEALPLPPPIRVFISSTMEDLQAERQAVAEALESLNLQTVRAESIGSQSVSPYEASLMMAQECDIYLGILGGRYGAGVPGDRYNRSITNIEYETAFELKKPILLYRKTDVEVEPAQEDFMRFAGDMMAGKTWRKFNSQDVPANLKAWVQQDVRAEIERQIEQHPEWANRPPARERVLLASLGLSPGAVTGLYYALSDAGKRPGRVITFSPTHRDLREAAGICQDEFERQGAPYSNRFVDIEDIESESDAKAFKDVFWGLLQEYLEQEVEILVGITGGRTVMGVLMAIVAQTLPEKVAMYHLDVDDDIERDGRLPTMQNFEYTDRWQELLKPPKEKRRLVPVPYPRFIASE